MLKSVPFPSSCSFKFKDIQGGLLWIAEAPRKTLCFCFQPTLGGARGWEMPPTASTLVTSWGAFGGSFWVWQSGTYRWILVASHAGPNAFHLSVVIYIPRIIWIRSAWTWNAACSVRFGFGGATPISRLAMSYICSPFLAKLPLDTCSLNLPHLIAWLCHALPVCAEDLQRTQPFALKKLKSCSIKAHDHSWFPTGAASGFEARCLRGS